MELDLATIRSFLVATGCSQVPCLACVTAFVTVVGVVRGWVSVELFCSAKLMMPVECETGYCRGIATAELSGEGLELSPRPPHHHTARAGQSTQTPQKALETQRLCLTLETCRGWQGRQQGPLHARMRS